MLAVSREAWNGEIVLDRFKSGIQMHIYGV